MPDGLPTLLSRRASNQALRPRQVHCPQKGDVSRIESTRLAVFKLLAVLVLSTAAAGQNARQWVGTPQTPLVSGAKRTQPLGSVTPCDDNQNSATGLPPELLEPCAPSAAPRYVPLDTQAKFALFTERISSPTTFLSAAFDAGYSHVTGDWKAYGQGADGYGKRYGATLADTEARSFFQSFLMPTLFHQDPRYFPSRKNGFLSRITYAVSRVLVTKSDSGNDTFNSSLLAGTVLSKTLTNLYYPRPERGFEPTASRIGGALLGDIQTNLLIEFGPDITRFLRKHEPGKLKRLQDRVLLRKNTLWQSF